MADVPIGHVTNGVHEPTWLAAPMRAVLDRHLPAGWLARAADPGVWAAVDAIPAAELWAARAQQRATLVEAVRARSVRERLGRGDSAGSMLFAAFACVVIDFLRIDANRLRPAGAN